MRKDEAYRRQEGRPGIFLRSSEGLEFERFAAFSDAIFAIAMTLLSVGIGVPVLRDGRSSAEMMSALQERGPELFSFFLSFAVIGWYWAAHHSFVARLAAVDRPLMSLTLVYLMFIAFLPFPTALMGKYEDNPVALAAYSVSVAMISGLEWVILRHARRRGHLRRAMPPDVYRWATVSALLPSGLFLLSIPAAFVSTLAARLTWLLILPAAAVVARFRPPGTSDWE